jgi:predicted ATPase/class 3 adenylate cyclase
VVEPQGERSNLPVGTVTFLRTDVEGSMALARAHGETWDRTNATHLGLIRRAVDAHGGVCVRTEGDAFFGAFQEAGAAVLAAVDAQRALSGHDWPAETPISVRMGLHSGEAHLAGADYGGFEVNRAARIAAAGHGGQVLLSESTRLLAEAMLPAGVAVRDLGRHVLRDVPTPERLHQLDIAGLRADFPPLRTSRPTAGNLPERLTSFLGRERDLEELAGLLASNRLVTLTGPGGIGKTSLAIELGRTWEDHVPDGVWFVPLDAIADATHVRTEVARGLGLFDGPDRPAADGLERYMADRSMVLIMDNFEHVLDAATEVTVVLRASPGSRVIVTSRAPLRVSGEQEYPVRSLAANDADVELFVQRARAIRPGWDPGMNSPVVREICELLDGLPLGLELAAARVALMPLPAIRDRLAARLPLPGSGPRDVPGRQRTLGATIAWSHDLLDPAEQRLLHDVAVFEGSFHLDQGNRVFDGDAVDVLGTLVEQSLAVGEGVDGDGMRFRLLRTIRSYALERLAAEGREADVRKRHAEAYLALVEEAAQFLPGADQARWLDRLAPEQPNIRTATQWAIDAGELELALGLVAGAWRFWQLAGHLADGRDLAEAALAMPGADAPTATRLRAVVAAGGIAYWRADVATATGYYEEELDLAIRLGDRTAEADAHFNLMFAKNMQIGAEAAWAEAEEAIRLFEELGDERGLARTIWARGTLVMVRDGPAQAARVFKEALEAFERTGDAWFHPMAVGSLTWCYFAQNEWLEAARSAAQTIAEYHALRDRTTTTISLAPSARVALEGGMAEEAAVLLGAFDNLCEIYGVRPPSGIMYLIAGANIEQRTREALDPDDFEAAKERGRRLTLDEAVALVIDVCGKVVGSTPGLAQ